MRVRRNTIVLASFSVFAIAAGAQIQPAPATVTIPLNVPTGAPLRLYLTGRVSKKVGAPAQAKVLEPVFAFDREVIPVGSIAIGRVTRTSPVPKWQRVRAIVNGDFTPLHKAEVEFTSLRLPDGREIPAHTVATRGLNTIYTPPRKPAKAQGPPPPPPKGVVGKAKQAVKDRIALAKQQVRTGIDTIRGPNKKERLIDYLWSRAPYHPQYWRRGARFDAALRDPIPFGTEAVKVSDLASLGSQPAADSLAHVRLLTGLNSASAKQGDRVEAVVTSPLYSDAHKLVLPEGTRLAGDVVLAKKARHFHRAGQLRFNFQSVQLPAEVATLPADAPRAAPMRTQATLAAAEGSGKAPLKVDSEGGVKAKESNTRFLAPVVSLMVASRAADNDAGRHHATSAAGDGNVSGRTLGGGLGFGMIGAAVSQSSPYVGMAFGYYGLAWSVYSAVVGRGGEVQFDPNAMMDIRFGARPQPGNHFVEATH